jgi:uncharacterized protein YacL
MTRANALRALFVVIAASVSFQLAHPTLSIAIGFGIGLLGIVVEIALRRLPSSTILGGALGLLAGLILAQVLRFLVGVEMFLLLEVVLGYVGLATGARIAPSFHLTGDHSSPASLSNPASIGKILDTSVIIDGRIAEICEAGFLDFELIIPQFVLRELQMVADSADSLKRNRGRRGLDILQRLQKNPRLKVRIVEDDFPAVREVDMKLIELAKLYQAKIVTNDFNLNKVAQLRGVSVLNINELANALRPVVLPGETMRVFILKEGKEYNQGVAYLDDGTMVVVDNARRLISKTIDIAVTSVLQTTAGKMIFGRYDDRQHAVYEKQETARPVVVRESQAASVAPPGV